jgi:hypothetical protein
MTVNVGSSTEGQPRDRMAHKFMSKEFRTMQTMVEDPDPDWIRIQSGPDSESGSGSRRAKMTHKSRKKFVKVHVFKCWMASFES